MKTLPRFLLLALFLAGLAACRRSPSAPSASKGPIPEQTIRNFSLKNFSMGQLTWMLTSPHADVFEFEHRVEMDRPFVQFYKDDQKGSTLQAEHGRVNTDSKDMWAWGNAVITSTDGAKLTSDWMHYSNERDLIQSTAPVNIVRGGSVTNGVGWEAKPDLSQILIRQQKVEISPEDVPKRRKK